MEAFPRPNPIITVKEARKLLGKDGNHLSDEQIQDLVITLTELSHAQLNQKIVPKTQQVEL